ncbi:MAG TPA: DUF2007 domain-containing protein [bacterium]|nr:DUF2007 domain-containing protein [bacterium]
MKDDLVEVARYSSRTEGEIAVARLESDGIEAFASVDDGGGAIPALDLVRGVRILVAAQDEERARASLGP